MKQILQSPRSGKLELAEVPAPAVQPGFVFVRNAYSVVSPGTERLMMDFARKSLLGKARARPDLVRQVARKLRNDGPSATVRTVLSRLDAAQPLGYSCAGVVEAVGEGVVGFVPGDRVACAGAGYANHAEFVVAPENLVAPVPEAVSLERAAYATVGAIAMQGVRVADPTLGEVAVVVGLGLIGQLTVQLLVANGCRVLGIDVDAARVQEAKRLGAEWAATTRDLPAGWADLATQGHGADFAVVTASASSSEPIQLAADLCRHKGRVALVGMMPMELDRRSFYDKELELRMSTSYGPGRYDRTYEETGLDYPLPYVRWTENRNMRSFLALAASGALDPGALDARVVAFEEAESAYEELAEGRTGSLAMLFRYDEAAEARRTQRLTAAAHAPKPGEIGVALIGAGNYAKGMLLPALKRQDGVRLSHVVASTGASAKQAADRFGFEACGTETAAGLGEGVDLAIVATRHGTHASLAEQALRAGKAVWLEKPIALDPAEADALLSCVEETQGFLVVGYNRRFSRHARAMREAFAGRAGPLAVHYVVAAGETPSGTWITDPAEGGGRIVGEVCHFVDTCNFLVDELPRTVFAWRLGADPERDDSTVAVLRYPSGSVATIEYLARTQSDLPKERFEVSGEGRTAHCENFRTTTITGRKALKTMNQDKGQDAQMAEVLAAIRSGAAAPFRLDELAAVSNATFGIERSLQTGQAVDLEQFAATDGGAAGA